MERTTAWWGEGGERGEGREEGKRGRGGGWGERDGESKIRSNVGCALGMGTCDSEKRKMGASEGSEI